MSNLLTSFYDVFSRFLSHLSVHEEKVLQTSYAAVDRKRKLQAEELGVPPTKLKWLNREFASKYDCLSDSNSDTEGVHIWETRGESVKDSNSVGADAESTISTSNEPDLDMDRGTSKECSSYWVRNSSKNVLNSLESGSTMKSCSTSLESSLTGKGHQYTYYDTDELHSSVNFEDDLLEFAGHIDCSCSDCETSNGKFPEKEIEEILHANGVAPNNYVLSSGRWIRKQDAQPEPQKLTIDKEFEQYFSTLML
ncbi:OLC1v1034874C1 [Oldenlandia corymbosa var. corymbosa]|uniref:OLC1v1034874C1 n=1 Tax=Oldenlandia corymbosa var. corymbosa TaxID=529605 RepID=A0AAV1CSD6_OLDCO|nr:OLC1v1034874C1 [Oldenlandia corymbosa var. corymbosa]